MINMDERICIEEGCNSLGQHMGRIRLDGSIIRRKRCYKHHVAHQATKKGLTPTQWTNSFHPYLKYRKEYCENIDHRLGFTCTATIVWPGQLQVDHIDGNHDNNEPENLQTLCANCHAVKTNIYRDWEDKKNKLFNNTAPATTLFTHLVTAS